MTDPLAANVKEQIVARIPLGRMGTPRRDCVGNSFPRQRRGGVYYRACAKRQRRDVPGLRARQGRSLRKPGGGIEITASNLSGARPNGNRLVASLVEFRADQEG